MRSPGERHLFVLPLVHTFGVSMLLLGYRPGVRFQGVDPVATCTQVVAFADPEILVEVEVDAVVDAEGGAAAG